MKPFTPLLLTAIFALSAIGCQLPKKNSKAAALNPEERAARLAEARTSLAAIEPQITKLEAATPEQLAETVHELGLGDAEFKAARQKKAEADKALVQIGYSHLPGHPLYKEKARLAKLAVEDLASRANWIRFQRKRDAELLRDTVTRLESADAKP